MTKKSQQKAWEKAISLMSWDELQFVVDHPDGYYPEFLELAKARMNELSALSDQEAMTVVVKKCLEKLGCPCKIDEDGALVFRFQGELFCIFFEDHYIDIWDYCWRCVKLENVEEVERLKQAINKANGDCSITSIYDIDEEEKTMTVSSTTSILYRPMIANLKDYLGIRLSNFFFAHELINSEMVLDKKLSEQLNDSMSEAGRGKSSDFNGRDLNDLLDNYFDEKKKKLLN